MNTESITSVDSQVEEQLQVRVLVLGELASHAKQPALCEQLMGQAVLRQHNLAYGRTVHLGPFVELIGQSDRELTQFHRLATNRVSELSSDSQESIARVLVDADIVFIVAADSDIDMRALLAVAKIAKLLGVLVVGFVVGQVAKDNACLREITDFGVFVAQIHSLSDGGKAIYRMLSGIAVRGLVCVDFADMYSVLDYGGIGNVVLMEGDDLAATTLLATDKLSHGGKFKNYFGLYAVLAGDQSMRMADLHAAVTVLRRELEIEESLIFAAPPIRDAIGGARRAVCLVALETSPQL